MPEENKGAGAYDDIISMTHHVSQRHPPLGRDSYAAQFSPFAALSGYDGVVDEAARTTDSLVELDEEAKDRIARILGEAINRGLEIVVTYFIPDARKDGGRYETVTGRAEKYDNIENELYLSGGRRIMLERITGVRSDYIQE